MRTLVAVIAVSIAFFALIVTPQGTVAGSTAEYVCPMVEHPEVFHEPGRCPRCGMSLLERSQLAQRSAAILVFEGVQVIDYAAPYEVLGQAGLQVFTVGPTADPVTAAMGQKLIPAWSFDDAPPARVLVLPGGNVDTDDARIVEWVRSRAAESEVVLSVCNGAFWLAKAGLLDGLTATTFYRLIDGLAQAAPKARVVRDQRFVDNGKIVTSAGLTSGMDGALHVVEKLYSRERAQEVALHLEYDWHPESTYARASMADRHLPDLDLGEGASFRRTRSLGDRDRWRIEGTVSPGQDRSQLLNRIGKQLRERVHWEPEGSADVAGWRFSDEAGEPWRASLEVSEAGAEGNVVALSLERVR